MSECVMQSVDQGVVFRGPPGSSRQSASFPGICVLPSGRWICTWRAAPEKTPLVGQHVLLSWSDDQGVSWSEPIAPFQAPALEGIAGSFRAAYLTAVSPGQVAAVLCWVEATDPARPFFNEATEGLLDTRILLSGSSDGGATWSAPRPIDTSPFHCPTPITGPLLVLPDGRWLCQFELNKPYDDTTPWSHRSILLVSKDAGGRWDDHLVVSSDPRDRVFYWDQRPSVLPDGTMLDLFWTFDRESASYLNIHGRRSADGRSWSGMWDTGVPGQPANPVGLHDGTLCLVYVDRTSAPAIKSRLSTDGGRTWPADSESVIHGSASSQTRDKRDMQDAWKEMSRFSLGLPATASLPNDEVLVVYYAGETTDRTAIHWARLKPHRDAEESSTEGDRGMPTEAPA